MGLNGLPTLQQRVGNRLWAPNISGMQNNGDAALATGAYGIHSYRGFWSRIEGRREHVEYDNSTTGADHDADYRKYQVGVDALIADKPDHQLFVGLNGFLTSASASVHSPSGIGDMDISGYGIGATATWYNTNGSYIDLQGQYVWHNANLNSDTLGTLVTGNEGNSYALSAEIGRRLERGDYTFTPQAQLIYSNSEFDRFTDPFGTQVSLGSAESLKGRLGLSIDRDTIWTDERGHKQRLHTYFIGNLHKEFLQGTSVSVSGTNLSSSIDGFAGELGLGFTRSINEENLTFYGEANVKTDLANFGDSYTYGGTIGLRVKF